MAKGIDVGVNGIARKVKAVYVGVDGVARKVKKGYIGVNGVARLFWESETPLAVAFRVGPAFGIPTTPFYFRTDVTGGKPPYRYAYTMSRNSSAYETVTGLATEAPTYTAFQTGTYSFRVTVTDDAGTSIMRGTDQYLFRSTNDAELNLTMAAARDSGTGVATWTLSSTGTGYKQFCILVFKDGLYYQEVTGADSLSLLLTEPGTYTAIGVMFMSILGTARTINATPITVT